MSSFTSHTSDHHKQDKTGAAIDIILTLMKKNDFRQFFRGAFFPQNTDVDDNKQIRVYETEIRRGRQSSRLRVHKHDKYVKYWRNCERFPG